MNTKTILRFFAFLLVVMTAAVQADAKDWLTEATVTADDPAYGEVFASKSSTAEAKREYASPSFVASQKTSTLFGSAAEHTYYIYARAKQGGKFLRWEDSKGNAVSQSPELTVSISTSTPNATIKGQWKAVFIEEPIIFAKATEYGLATATPLVNKPGDEVTLSCNPMYNVLDAEDYVAAVGKQFNPFCQFSHWTDETGATVSTEPTFSVIAGDQPKEYTAVFTLKPTLTGKGYYRVWNVYGVPLRVAGNRSITLSTFSAVSLYGDIDAITNPYGKDYFLGRGGHTDATGYSGEHLYNFYDDPSAIIYIDGNFNEGNSRNWKTDNVVIGAAKLVGQGLATTDFLRNKTFDISWTVNPGFYQVTYSSFALGYMWDTNENKQWGTLKVGQNYHNALQQHELAPITEEYMDTERYWFGACPDPDMAYDGGYWTSMYTAFPYRLVEQDGHEAYIVTMADTEKGIALLKKIENGIVPANTAVLIKCKEPAEVEAFLAHNLLHKDFAPLQPQNRLIPLEPNDPSIDPSVADGNLLSGVFQLNNQKPDNMPSDKEVGHVRFDKSKMRVFGVNAAGDVGFYVLPQVMNYAGTAMVEAELARNRAYLDFSKFPQGSGSQVRSFRLMLQSEVDGVEDIAVDAPAPANGPVYDLFGRQVGADALVPGNIYISNGQKFIHR